MRSLDASEPKYGLDEYQSRGQHTAALLSLAADRLTLRRLRCAPGREKFMILEARQMIVQVGKLFDSMNAWAGAHISRVDPTGRSQRLTQKS